jgi:hypothetical protein
MQEIKAYGIESREVYEAASITYRKIHKEADKILDEIKANLDEDKPEIITVTAFLNILVDSYASLYLFIDEDSYIHYFMKKEEGPLYELYQLKKYATWSYGSLGRRGYRIDKKYLGILQMLFYECPEI